MLFLREYWLFTTHILHNTFKINKTLGAYIRLIPLPFTILSVPVLVTKGEHSDLAMTLVKTLSVCSRVGTTLQPCRCVNHSASLLSAWINYTRCVVIVDDLRGSGAHAVAADVQMLIKPSVFVHCKQGQLNRNQFVCCRLTLSVFTTPHHPLPALKMYLIERNARQCIQYVSFGGETRAEVHTRSLHFVGLWRFVIKKNVPKIFFNF